MPQAGVPYQRFLSPVPITLHEPNVLLLDRAEYALDDEEWNPAEEILRADNSLRCALGWPERGDVIAQPWVEQDRSTPHTLRLRYRFQSEIPISGAYLALENAGNTKVFLRGFPAGEPSGWYVDKCIEKIPLPDIVPGENILELLIPYGRKTNVEAVYLLGDFGVRVQGTVCTLLPAVKRLTFGDITRQGLPFYGGNLTYHLEAESHNGFLEIAATCYRGHLLRVAVDGDEKGNIVFSPYRLRLPVTKDGIHRIDITCYGCRINTFGQLHQNNRTPGVWWGPDSWRSIGASWTDEYHFWKQGILKSPEIR